MTPARERFFTQMAAEFAVRDQFRLALLELDGKGEAVSAQGACAGERGEGPHHST